MEQALKPPGADPEIFYCLILFFVVACLKTNFYINTSITCGVTSAHLGPAQRSRLKTDQVFENKKAA
jgi:hypothetical protein